MARYDLDYGYDFEFAPRGRRFGAERTRGRRGRSYRGYGREPGMPAHEREPFGGYTETYRGYGTRPRGRYGREYTEYGFGRFPEQRGWGYDRGYRKSRWETDYGDPFRDRERGTPIRMMRGGWPEYGREFRRREPRRGMRYEREYRPRRRRQY